MDSAPALSIFQFSISNNMLFGDYRVEVVPDTEFRLDGGAMFGVVPRILWERVCPPDELNRIRLNMNCVFIDTGKEKILVETGIGEKWNEKQARMYGIFREKPFAETLFENTGCRPDEITIVINTHLHFDHAGGNTIRETTGRNPTPREHASTRTVGTLPNGRVSARTACGRVFAKCNRDGDADDKKKEWKYPVGGREAVPLGVVERPINRRCPRIIDQHHAGDGQTAEDIEGDQALVCCLVGHGLSNG